MRWTCRRASLRSVAPKPLRRRASSSRPRGRSSNRSLRTSSNCDTGCRLPGKRGVEGWQRWVEKHFTCDVRTVNRALSAILGPEAERQKPKSRKGRKQVVEALIYATEPAIRLARKYPKDPDAEELLGSLETEELAGLIPEPQPRPESLIDEMRRYKRVKAEELYSMGLKLAHAVNDGASSVRSDTDDGKRILGLAKHMLEIEKKAEPPQDKMSRSPGSNFVVEDPIDAMIDAKRAERQLSHAVHCRPDEEMGKHKRTLCGLPLRGLTTHAPQRHGRLSKMPRRLGKVREG